MKRKTKHNIYKVKKITYKIYDKFDRNDIAQMLTSIFIVVQVFVLRTSEYEFNQSLILFFPSIIVSGIILWIIARQDFYKHFLTGFLIVGTFSFLLGYILNASVEKMLIAFALGLPVATTVDALKK